MSTRRQLPADMIVELYRAGLSAPAIAARLDCSQTGVRKVLYRVGVSMRARGGVVKSVSSAEIVRLRDVERLSWEDIARRTGLSDEGARSRYRREAGRLPGLEWHRSVRQRPDLDPMALTAVNSAVDLKAHIVASYRRGSLSARQLARQYGISDTTVRRWARSSPSGEEAVEVGGRADGFFSESEDDIWCTPAEAGPLLGVSASRVRQLIDHDRVLPAEADVDGRLRLRRSQVRIAAREAGPPGSYGRWDVVRRLLFPSEPPHPPPTRRPSAVARRLADLPWAEIVARYETGANVAALAVELNVARGTLRHHLQVHGAQLRRGRARTELPVTDDELRAEHAAGATLAELGARHGASTSVIWRRINLTRPSEPAEPPLDGT